MTEQKSRSPVVLAVCGKGGVGKTSISAAMVNILVRNGQKKILAIDADPAAGLASVLGLTIRKTVDNIRNDLIQRIEDKATGNKDAFLTHLDYEMFGAVTEKKNLAFLAMGRPEREGCYCQVNSILKAIIVAIADNFDYVVIDGEAGVEQINRRVMEKGSHLILVADPSAKAIHVAQTIQQVARQTVAYKKSGLVVNRCQGTKEIETISIPKDLELLGWIPEDDVVRTRDIQGKSVLGLPHYKALTAVEKCLQSLGLPG